jgi:hypothetical protein
VVARHSEGNLSPDGRIVVRCDNGVDDQSLDDSTVVGRTGKVVDQISDDDDTVVGRNNCTPRTGGIGNEDLEGTSGLDAAWTLCLMYFQPFHD